jgi:multiple sugar transport system ATP-binding protein
MMAELQLRQVRKSFQTLEVIHGIDLTVDDGSFTVFVGPSGCGKSTLLRMISGLEETSGGEIWLDGERCDHLLPSARGMAMVFQSYALYPHMSVEENLRFGLENQRLAKSEIATRVDKAADILQIKHLLKRRPNQLSGGQSQRVAIGRAIVKEPKVFLFDEPFGALDEITRERLNDELLALFQRKGFASLFITHSIYEAVFLSTRVLVMSARPGRIVAAFDVPFAYPRPPELRFEAAFAELAGQVSHALRGAHT